MNNKLVIVSSIEEVHHLSLPQNTKIQYTCIKCNRIQQQKFININAKDRLICAHCYQVEVRQSNPNYMDQYKRASETLKRSYKTNPVLIERQENHKKKLAREEKIKNYNKLLREINKQIKLAHLENKLKQKSSKRKIYKKSINRKIKKVAFTCIDCNCNTVVTERSFYNRKFFNNEKLCKSCYLRRYWLLDGKKDKMLENLRKTSMEKWGVPIPFMAKENQEKLKFNNIKKYGVENAFQRKDVKEKIKNTNKERYGAEVFNQSEYRNMLGFNSFLKKYKYNNMYFDSSWELAFWLYCADHKITISKETERFEYDFNGTKHYYYPDFKIPCGLIEIKGTHLIRDDKWINPYSEVDDGLFEAKHQCALRNNVIIISEKDMKRILIYIKNKYGKNYLKSYQIHYSSYMSKEKRREVTDYIRKLGISYRDYKKKAGKNAISWNEYQKFYKNVNSNNRVEES